MIVQPLKVMEPENWISLFNIHSLSIEYYIFNHSSSSVIEAFCVKTAVTKGRDGLDGLWTGGLCGTLRLVISYVDLRPGLRSLHRSRIHLALGLAAWISIIAIKYCRFSRMILRGTFTEDIFVHVFNSFLFTSCVFLNLWSQKITNVHPEHCWSQLFKKNFLISNVSHIVNKKNVFSTKNCKQVARLCTTKTNSKWDEVDAAQGLTLYFNSAQIVATQCSMVSLSGEVRGDFSSLCKQSWNHVFLWVHR